MDFGNIIFIGIVVLAVISNIVKAAKKTQTPQSKPLVGRPLVEATVVQTATVPPAQKKPKKTVKPVFVPLPTFVEGERQIFLEEETPTMEIAKEYNFSNLAEIRKGIIFSEIFNRKY